MKIFFIVLVFFFVLSGFSSTNDFALQKQAFKELTSGQAIIIDVREKSELASGIAKGAKFMPWSKIKVDSAEWQSFAKGLDNAKNIYFYCARGGRAQMAIDALKKKGFTRVINLGGFDDWVKAELPAVKAKR